MKKNNVIIPDYYPFNKHIYSKPALPLQIHYKQDKPIKPLLSLMSFPHMEQKKPIDELENTHLVLYNNGFIVNKQNEIDNTLIALNRLVTQLNDDIWKVKLKEKMITNLFDYAETNIETKPNELVELDDKIDNLSDLIKVAKKYKDDARHFTINMNILKKLIDPLEELQHTVGMELIKNQLVDQILSSLQNLYDEDQRFHTVIQGPPGVGKTMIAKIISKIYLRMGILKNKSSELKFNVAKRSDLVGRFLGHTAKQTQTFINNSVGGVMFIDEVYSLGNKEQRDSYAKECIDTLTLNLTEKKNFVCIVAGYAKDIQECFFDYNSGLKRRFSFTYEIQEYNSHELRQIFVSKIKDSNWKIDENIKTEWLDQFINKNKEEFVHYGGDIDTLLLNCKTVHGRRIFGKNKKYRKIITKDDIINGFKKFKNSKPQVKNDMIDTMFL